MTDHDYMALAVSLARKAKGFTSPNPCVGAVVVKDGRIVGQGYHRAAGQPHAEVEAINDAGDAAHGAAIYVTLEPCNHFGKTPPCTHKILEAGITKVIVGCKDPNPFVSGGGIKYLQENGVDVTWGILEKETSALIEEFIWFVQNDKNPFVILKCASTLDGRIATSSGDSKWITNEKSRAHVHCIRHECDAILVGSGTLHADDPSLTARIEGRDTKDPVRIILDTKLSIKKDAKVLTQTSNAGTIIVTGPGISESKKAAFENANVRIMEVPLKDQRLDLKQLMIKLGQMSILSVLIEGGSVVAGAALRAGIVNKMMFFLAPKFLGGSDGYPIFDGEGPTRIDEAFMLKDIGVRQFDSDLLVEGYLK